MNLDCELCVAFRWYISRMNTMNRTITQRGCIFSWPLIQLDICAGRAMSSKRWIQVKASGLPVDLVKSKNQENPVMVRVHA